MTFTIHRTESFEIERIRKPSIHMPLGYVFSLQYYPVVKLQDGLVKAAINRVARAMLPSGE